MAEATRHPAGVETKIVHIPESYTLRLSREEVDFLIAVMSKVGGNPENSPRKHERAITEALFEVTGYRFSETEVYEYLRNTPNSGIEFDDYV